MLFQKHTGGSPGSPHPEERKEADRPREQEKEARRFEALSHRKLYYQHFQTLKYSIKN